jgi:glucans biosynthesis protein C
LRLQLARPGFPFLLFLPSAAIELSLRPFWPGDANNLVDDWANLVSKAAIFVVGFVLCSGEEAWGAIEKHRFRALALGCAAMVLLYWVWFSGWQAPTASRPAIRVLRAFNLWCWLLVILGFGVRHLRFNHPFLRYATEAVYPWYILHQTVIVAIGYYVAGWDMALWAKFAVVLGSMVAVTFGLHEFLIRRVALLRPLFGLRLCPGRKAPASAVPGAAVLIER